MSFWSPPATAHEPGQYRNAGPIQASDELYKVLLAAGAINVEGRVTSEKALQQCVVFRCVSLICGVIGASQIVIKDDLTKVEMVRHPLRRVLNRKPNRFQTSRDFKKFLTMHALLRGNAYARIVWSLDRKRILALNPLNPDRMTVTQNPDLTLRYDYRNQKGERVIFQQADILHMRGLSLDGIIGVSVLSLPRPVCN